VTLEASHCDRAGFTVALYCSYSMYCSVYTVDCTSVSSVYL